MRANRVPPRLIRRRYHGQPTVVPPGMYRVPSTRSAAGTSSSSAPRARPEARPAEAVFQFPGGLADHLKEQVGDRGCATTEFFKGRQDFPNSQGLVEWAIGLDQPAIVTTNFRPFEAVILHMVSRARADVPVVWMDNGYITDATYRFADEVTKLLGLNLHIYLPLRSRAHREAVDGQTPALDDPRHAAFTQEVKLEPFERALRETAPKVWFTALRATDTTVRASHPYTAPKSGIHSWRNINNNKRKKDDRRTPCAEAPTDTTARRKGKDCRTCAEDTTPRRKQTPPIHQRRLEPRLSRRRPAQKWSLDTKAPAHSATISTPRPVAGRLR